MPRKPTKRSTPVLPAELTIYTVAELHPQWLNILKDADGTAPVNEPFFLMDASATSEVDSAGLQLLLSLSNAFERQSRPLRLINASEALSMACVALGASALLDMEVKGAMQ
jgi:anti-anti-sigma regulatory factor